MWRATTGGDQFRYPVDGSPVNVPEFAFDRIDQFVRLVTEQEKSLKNWFDRHGIVPMQVAYEDLLGNRTEVVLDVLRFLGVGDVEKVDIPQPEMLRQTDTHTERYISLYRQEFERRDSIEIRGQGA